jgi:pyruvate-ferredoxin/flavodoxin oxidoreductase
MRLAVDQQKKQAEELLIKLASELGQNVVDELLQAQQTTEAEIQQQRQRVKALNKQLDSIANNDAKRLKTLSENLCVKSVWIVGGDGWAYDIGYGGVDHVLASSKNVNILVLDTEVYSNTGGQKSKATPTGAVAKFAASGKAIKKKDLAQQAMAYENVYVARVAYGAKDMQTLRAFHEAESYPGVSIIIAYSPCIAHGMDMADNHKHQKLAVNSGHWTLLRYDPRKLTNGDNPLKLDSKAPSIPYGDFTKLETRFSMLWRSHPDLAEKYLKQAQTEVNERYSHYKQLADISYADHKLPEADSLEEDKK